MISKLYGVEHEKWITEALYREATISSFHFPQKQPLKRKVIKEGELFHGETLSRMALSQLRSDCPFLFLYLPAGTHLACCLIRYRCLRPPFADEKGNGPKRNKKRVNTLRSDPDPTKIGNTCAGEIIVKLNPKVIKSIYGVISEKRRSVRPKVSLYQ